MTRWQPWSRASVWRQLRQFYAREGPAAFRLVPHHTSNCPRMAEVYASTAAAFVETTLRRGLLDLTEPLMTIELAAGSGALSHRFVRELRARLTGPLASLQHRHVLTDSAPSMLEAWTGASAWRQALTEGTVDVGRFDLAKPKAIHLRQSGTTVAPGRLRNPLIIIANYTFDSIPFELLHLERDLLRRVEVCDASSLHARFRPGARLGRGFATPGFAQLSRGLARRTGWLAYPRLALEACAYLRRFSAGPSLMLCADHGGRDALATAPPMAFQHAGRSFPMSPAALRAYCEAEGGSDAVRHFVHGFWVAAAVFAAPAIAGPPLAAFRAALRQRSPSRVTARLRRLYRGGFVSATDLTAEIVRSSFDPAILSWVGVVLAQRPSPAAPEVGRLIDALRRVESNLYCVDADFTESLDLATIYDALGAPRDAGRVRRAVEAES